MRDKLYQNYPNPFDPSIQSTEFCIDLRQDSHVEFAIYNILGKKVRTLVDRYLEAQSCYKADFKGSNLSSGIYFARLKTDQGIQSVPLTIVN
ncbi:T9SS type A sorting domain-containing protein [Aliifodinibius sp. S!AR15-10]|uniref:T9SS type A sorting domain-containing protein n=1 Tax=Aliifodinibius sp. S!AR15-10 TaxID=2950437 RepID=UPI0038F7CB63